MQQYGLEMLIMADSLEARARETEQLRLLQRAAAAEPDEDASQQITDYSDFDRSQDEDVDFDYSAVEWEQASADDWGKIQAALAQDQVRVGSEDQNDADVPPVPDVDFDREWT